MPTTIALVVVGRCRPSPDRVPEGASPDRDARGVVSGGRALWRREWFLPVLSTPAGGVGRVDCDHGEVDDGNHGAVDDGDDASRFAHDSLTRSD